MTLPVNEPARAQHTPRPSARTLWKGALILSQDPAVGELRGDVLVDGATITEVSAHVEADDGTVVDASRFALLPGFVDTHRHTWQTALRGITAGKDLAEYQAVVQRGFGPRCTPADVYAGNALGALGALDAGITTLCDESHIQNSPQHADAAVAALRDTGIRAVFDYGWPSTDSAVWMTKSSRPHPDYIRELHRDQFMGQRTQGLLSLQLMARGPAFTQLDVTRRDLALARDLDIRTTMHVKRGSIDALESLGALDDRLTPIHCSTNDEDELRKIVDAGAFASVAANVELNMVGLGAPPVRAFLNLGMRPSLSVDVETTVGGDMFSVMRAALISQTAEDVYGSPRPGARVSSRDVLAMATIEGARAAGLGHAVGSITPGKQADFVLVDLTHVNLVAAPDPVGVIVASGHAGNIDTVVLAGRVVKRRGALLDDDLVSRVSRLAIASRERLEREVAGRG